MYVDNIERITAVVAILTSFSRRVELRKHDALD